MIEMMDDNNISSTKSVFGISDIVFSLSEDEKKEINVNDLEDILEDSDVLNSIRDLARKNGISDVNIFSNSLVRIIKSTSFFEFGENC